MILNAQEHRQAILKLWDQHQDTWQIGRLLRRPEHQIERELHRGLKLRRAVKRSLRARQ